ncbi:hypothetical protein ACODT5_09630 [Streptomyces sp. 5.8]|uniref:hypothetical protein n=1 Tax=Streptomyces sp. 5.8 TaxID=3406571 RepID=UPI003BB7C484
MPLDNHHKVRSATVGNTGTVFHSGLSQAQAEELRHAHHVGPDVDAADGTWYAITEEGAQ